MESKHEKMYVYIVLHMNIRLNHMRLFSKSSNSILFNLTWDAYDNIKILMCLLFISLRSKFLEDKNHSISVLFLIFLFIYSWHIYWAPTTCRCYARCWGKISDTGGEGPSTQEPFYPILARIYPRINQHSRFMFVIWFWKENLKCKLKHKILLPFLWYKLISEDIGPFCTLVHCSLRIHMPRRHDMIFAHKERTAW